MDSLRDSLFKSLNFHPNSFPKKFKYEPCVNYNDECEFNADEGVKMELMQFSNVANAALFMFSLGFMAPLAWFFSPIIVVVLYLVPELIETDAQLSDMDDGIPIYYYNLHFFSQMG